MVRGHAKEVAQQKNAAKKDAANKKGGGRDGAAAAKTQMTCPICKVQMINYKQMTQHYDSKHAKETCPPEDKF